MRLGPRVPSAGHRLSLCGQQHKIGKDGVFRGLKERPTGFVRDIRDAQDDLHALIGTSDDGRRA
jgi:hypothetical protein